METTTATESLDYEVYVRIEGVGVRTLAQFHYESDALLFARAYFAGDNGGDLAIYGKYAKLCAYSRGDEWYNLSDGARTDGYNG